MRRLLVPGTAVALMVAMAYPVAAASDSPKHEKDAGEESQAVAEAAEWFIDQRVAPNDAIDNNAYAAGAAQAAQLPTVGGAWTERTMRPGTDGNDFSDSPDYVDPTSGFSNSGSGDRWVA